MKRGSTNLMNRRGVYRCRLQSMGLSHNSPRRNGGKLFGSDIYANSMMETKTCGAIELKAKCIFRIVIKNYENYKYYET